MCEAATHGAIADGPMNGRLTALAAVVRCGHVLVAADLLPAERTRRQREECARSLCTRQIEDVR